MKEVIVPADDLVCIGKEKLQELIRCKECKWADWYTAVNGKRYCYCTETSVGGRTAEDFCSYAERKEE